MISDKVCRDKLLRMIQNFGEMTSLRLVAKARAEQEESGLRALRSCRHVSY